MRDRSHRGTHFIFVTLACALIVGLTGPTCLRAQSSPTSPAAATPPAASNTSLPPQPRKTRVRVPIDPNQIEIDDGDTAIVAWTAQDRETVRIIGIDTPETQHLPHNIPYPQPFGEEARGFASGAFAAATRIELLRAPTLDQYGRTLGYFFLNGKNYSVLVIAARLAEESVTQFGDNGFPEEAAAVLKAARAAGPLPFESPASYRLRMRHVADWMKAHGTYPTAQ